MCHIPTQREAAGCRPFTNTIFEKMVWKLRNGELVM